MEVFSLHVGFVGRKIIFVPALCARLAGKNSVFASRKS